MGFMGYMAARLGVDGDVEGIGTAKLRSMVIKARDDIRWHRDQRGHYRCWLDDIKVYSNLPEYSNPYQRHLCSRDEFLARCEAFFDRRQVPNEKVAWAEARRQRKRDTDLDTMSAGELRSRLIRLRNGIRHHMSAGKSLTWREDARLYALLPDRTKAITSLPEKELFLRGCRRFCSTRGDPPKLHEW